MQDAELFFQAADHRHLGLYLDALAAGAAREQATVSICAQRNRDEHRNLTQRIEKLECELQSEKDENALLQQLISQKQDKTDSIDTLFAHIQGDLADALPRHPIPPSFVSVCSSLYRDMKFLREQFQKSQTFPLFRKKDIFIAQTDPGRAKNKLWKNYLELLNIRDMQEILHCCQKPGGPLKTLPASAARLFSPLPELQLYFVMVTSCLDAVGNMASPRGFDDFMTLLSDVLVQEKKVEDSIQEQEEELAGLFVALCPFLMEPEDDNRS